LSLDHPRLTSERGRSSREARAANPLLKLFAFAQIYATAAAELRRSEEGQTMAEYGVMLGVITLAVITAISLLSTGVRNAIGSVTNLLPGN